MKAVLNDCYGGFGLSTKAMIELIKIKSDIVKVETLKEYTGSSKPVRRKDEKWEKVKDYEFVSYIPDVLHKDGKVYRLKDEDSPETRSHPDLVEVVKKLGEEAAGNYAKLRIADIPDGVPWEVNDYDGMESAEEVHRSW